jgi:hypothetical protein
MIDPMDGSGEGAMSGGARPGVDPGTTWTGAGGTGLPGDVPDADPVSASSSSDIAEPAHVEDAGDAGGAYSGTFDDSSSAGTSSSYD